MKKKPDVDSPRPVDLDELFRRAMKRVRVRTRAAVVGPLFAGSMALGMPLAGCADGADLTDDPAALVEASGKADWAQLAGERNTEMVSYSGAFWDVCSYGTRFCSIVDVFLKVRVRPVADASPFEKNVGVEWRSPHDGSEKTAVGYYFSTLENGDEEWHVPVRGIRMYDNQWRPGDVFTFNVWYEPNGTNGPVYFDDNNGEFHVANNGSDTQVITVSNPWDLQLDDNGVHGSLRVDVVDLDFDKQIELVGTVNGWTDTLRFEIGDPGQKNVFYWVRDDFGHEYWQIDLDIPGADISKFEYAVVYRHGGVNGAKPYEFWDNNWGSNHKVERTFE